MNGIKIYPADHWFSLCLRESQCWTCEYCGKAYPSLSRGLHCAHYQGRSAWATRFEKLNCFSLCFFHHQYLDSRKGTFARFFADKRGVDIYDIVMEKSENTALGKEYRHSQKKIAAHFKAEYEKMLVDRAKGVTGKLDFDGYL